MPIPSAATVIGPFTRTKGIPFTLVLYLLKKTEFSYATEKFSKSQEKIATKEGSHPLGIGRSTRNTAMIAGQTAELTRVASRRDKSGHEANVPLWERILSRCTSRANIDPSIPPNAVNEGWRGPRSAIPSEIDPSIDRSIRSKGGEERAVCRRSHNLQDRLGAACSRPTT